MSKGDPVDLGDGWTPLVHAVRLGRELGLRSLYLKCDGLNPTGSVKDRAVSVAVARSMELGFDTVAAASAGNLGLSLAAHAAHATLRSFVFVPENIEPALLNHIGAFAPRVVTVRGAADDVNRLCSDVAARYSWAFVNSNMRAYYAEGLKTLAHEIVEQLDWRRPDRVIVPMASGLLITSMQKGFTELRSAGLIRDARVALHGAQPEGCSPIVNAFEARSDIIHAVSPATTVRSLALGNPADGRYALQTIRDSGGTAEKVSDQEALDSVLMLARSEGILADLSGGVALAALAKMVAAKQIRPSESVVVVLTASGDRDLHHSAARVQRPASVQPNVASFETTLGIRPTK